MPNLFPEINLPTLISPRTSQPKKYYPAPHFDFDSGDFLFDSAGRIIIADGREAFEQWCIKACMTERGTKIAYTDNYGAELEDAIKFNDAGAIQSMIVKTITETILAHECAEYVKNFSFEIEGDELKVSFDVKGRDWENLSRLTVIY